MATNDGRLQVLNLADALELYYDLLEQSKGLDQQVRLLRDRILSAMAARKISEAEVEGYEAVRQFRHHAPQLNEERAEELLGENGRLEECLVKRLDVEKARQVIEELFRHGALTKDELPYIYVKPTEALVVRRAEPVAEEMAAEPEIRRAA